MRPVRWFRLWVGLFLLGLVSTVITAAVGFLIFSFDAPNWMAGFAVGGMALMLIAVFGWLVTLDQPRRPRSSN